MYMKNLVHTKVKGADFELNFILLLFQFMA